MGSLSAESLTVAAAATAVVVTDLATFSFHISGYAKHLRSLCTDTATA